MGIGKEFCFKKEKKKKTEEASWEEKNQVRVKTAKLQAMQKGVL